MFYQIKKQILILLVGGCILTASNSFAIEDGLCDLAYDVAEMSLQQWNGDQDKALKLMIKAQELCPDDAVLTYNLGMAYAMYGSENIAVNYLLKSVESEPQNADWLNNTAAVLLRLNSQLDKALKFSEQAVHLKPDDPQIIDTLAQLQFATGTHIAALQNAQSAASQNGAGPQIMSRYDELRDRYVNQQLQMIKDGGIDGGLAALLKLDGDITVARIYGQALAQLGRADEALEYLQVAIVSFPVNPELQQAFDDVIEQKILSFYQLFQQGDTTGSLAQSHRFASQYPEDPQAKKAFEELFKAFTSDTATIALPEQRQRVAQNTPVTNSDALLLSIGQSHGTLVSTDIDLTVDVDEQIPFGKDKRPDAIAVVIGNRHYRQQNRGLTDVQYADRDAKIMRQYLINLLGYSEENILTYLDATSSDLRTVFGDGTSPGKLHDYVRANRSEVFIYYVGHGAPTEQGEAYLVPVDTDVNYLANTGYPLDRLYTTIEKLQAKQTTVVLDACFSGNSVDGMLVNNVSPAMLKNVTPVRSVADSVIFTGADKDQVATWYPEKRHSTFTYYFLKGISGAADVDQNRELTVAEMGRYLKEEVSYAALRQSSRKQEPLVVGNEKIVLATLE